MFKSYENIILLTLVDGIVIILYHPPIKLYLVIILNYSEVDGLYNFQYN